VAAVGAGAVSAADPGDTNSGAGKEWFCRASLDRTGEGARSTPSPWSVAQGRLRPHLFLTGLEVSGDDFAYDLVSGDDSRMAGREFAFNDM
jgi:hypothetical protein